MNRDASHVERASRSPSTVKFPNRSHHIHDVDERRRLDGTVGDVHRGEDATGGLGRGIAISRVHLPDGRPGLQPVTDLRMHHDTDGRVDRVALPEPAGSQPRRSRARSPPPRPPRGRRSGPRAAARGPERRGSTPAGSSTTRGSPPCASIIRTEPLERSPDVDRLGRLRERLLVTDSLACSSSARAANSSASSRRRPPVSPRSTATASAMSSALPTASPSGWDMSVTAALAARPQPAASARHRFRELPRVLRGLHEGARSPSSRRGGSGPSRPPASWTSRWRRSTGSTGPWPSRRAARRARRRPAPGSVTARPPRIPPPRPAAGSPPGERSVRSAGDRLELVQRPARVPEPTARELRHGEPERRGQRGEHQGDAVRDPAGRVLVHGRRSAPAEPPENRSVSPDSTIAFVRARVSSSSSPRSRHAIRNAAASASEIVARGVSLDERPDVSGASVLPSRFAATIVARILHARRTDPGRPRCSSRARPRPEVERHRLDDGRRTLDASRPSTSTSARPLDAQEVDEALPSSPPPSAPEELRHRLSEIGERSLVPRS